MSYSAFICFRCSLWNTFWNKVNWFYYLCIYYDFINVKYILNAWFILKKYQGHKLIKACFSCLFDNETSKSIDVKNESVCIHKYSQVSGLVIRQINCNSRNVQTVGGSTIWYPSTQPRRAHIHTQKVVQYSRSEQN